MRQLSFTSFRAGLLAAVLIVMATGCATTISSHKVLDALMGDDIDTVIATWGPPTEVRPDGKGGQIYLYPDGNSQVFIYFNEFKTAYFWRVRTVTEGIDYVQW